MFSRRLEGRVLSPVEACAEPGRSRPVTSTGSVRSLSASKEGGNGRAFDPLRKAWLDRRHSFWYDSL